jgi:hypothetical protein
VVELINNVRSSIKEVLGLDPSDYHSDAQLAQRLAGLRKIRNVYLIMPPPPPDRTMMQLVCSTFPGASFLLLGGDLSIADVEAISSDAALLMPPITQADENELVEAYENARQSLTLPA